MTRTAPSGSGTISARPGRSLQGTRTRRGAAQASTWRWIPSMSRRTAATSVSQPSSSGLPRSAAIASVRVLASWRSRRTRPPSCSRRQSSGRVRPVETVPRSSSEMLIKICPPGNQICSLSQRTTTESGVLRNSRNPVQAGPRVAPLGPCACAYLSSCDQVLIPSSSMRLRIACSSRSKTRASARTSSERMVMRRPLKSPRWIWIIPI